MAANTTNGARVPGLAAPELAARPAADLPSLGAPGAAAAGLTADHKDEARELGRGAGFRGQGTADGADSPGTAQDRQAGRAVSSHSLAAEPRTHADAKRFATLRARLALAGWVLSRTEPGDGLPAFLAVRWNMPRELADLAAVERFADLVGAPA